MDTTASIGTIFTILPFIILFFIAASAFFKVDQQSVAINERFGKFLRTAEA